ncbi:hypothetical protein B566_EDAN015982 [Ephemera danica]|nr:hypothetical protein B566_EDAN015982 [Ephemera danica]
MSCTNYGNTINAASDTSEMCDKNLNTCQNAFGPELPTDPRGESIGKQGLRSSDPQLDIDLAIKRMDVDEDMTVQIVRRCCSHGNSRKDSERYARLE